MNWQKIRKLAMDEANYECCDCGNTDNIEVHHIKYPAEKIDDTLVFCRDCHRWFHKKFRTYHQEKTKRIYLMIPKDKFDYFDKFKELAENQRKSRNQLILELVENYVIDFNA